MAGWPVRHDGAPPTMRPAPLLGRAHGRRAGNWLGLGADEIEGLAAAEKVVIDGVRPSRVC